MGDKALRQAAHDRRRRALRARLPRRRAGRRAPDRRGARARLPAAGQGGGRRRRARHAAGARRRRARGGDRRRAARGAERVRRRHADARAADRGRPPHRDPGLRRRARQRDPPRRARLHGAAAAAEGDRGIAVAGRRRRDARGDGRATRSPPRWPSATSARARSSSSSTPAAAALLPGDEHAAAGRASGDRDGHRARPRRVAVARRRRRAAAAARRSEVRLQGHAIEARLYAEDPYAASFAPQTGTRALVAARGRDGAAGRAHRPRHRRRRRGLAVLRRDGGQGDRPRPRPRRRDPAPARRARATRRCSACANNGRFLADLLDHAAFRGGDDDDDADRRSGSPRGEPLLQRPRPDATRPGAWPPPRSRCTAAPAGAPTAWPASTSRCAATASSARCACRSGRDGARARHATTGATHDVRILALRGRASCATRIDGVQRRAVALRARRRTAPRARRARASCSREPRRCPSATPASTRGARARRWPASSRRCWCSRATRSRPASRSSASRR